MYEYLSVSVRNVSFQVQVKADGRSHTDKTPSRRRVSWHHLLATSHTSALSFPSPLGRRGRRTRRQKTLSVESKCCGLGRLGEPTLNDNNSYYFVLFFNFLFNFQFFGIPYSIGCLRFCVGITKVQRAVQWRSPLHRKADKCSTLSSGE